MGIGDAAKLELLLDFGIGNAGTGKKYAIESEIHRRASRDWRISSPAVGV
jgi:hypothetical protein